MLNTGLLQLSLATESVNADSVTHQFDRPLHDATLMMSAGVCVPVAARSRYYEVTRGRRSHLMGSYPLVASAFAASGAPFPNVTAPMTALKSLLFLTFYRPTLPPFMEANARETDANGLLDHAQHHAINDPHDAALMRVVDSCTAQIEETRVLRSVAMSMLHKRMA